MEKRAKSSLNGALFKRLSSDILKSSDDNRLEKLSSRFKPRTLRKIEKLSRDHGTSKAEIVRKATRIGLKEVQKK